MHRSSYLNKPLLKTVTSWVGTWELHRGGVGRAALILGSVPAHVQGWVIPAIRLFCLRLPGGFTAHQIMMLSLLTHRWKSLLRVPSQRRVGAELPCAG